MSKVIQFPGEAAKQWGVARQVILEEVKSAQDRPGRRPSGRVTVGLVSKLEAAGRFEEADALAALLPDELVHKLRKKAGPADLERQARLAEEYGPRHSAAMRRHFERKEKERALPCHKRGKSIMVRFNLEARHAQGLGRLAEEIGIPSADLGRLILAQYAEMTPAEVLRNLADMMESRAG